MPNISIKRTCLRHAAYVRRYVHISTIMNPFLPIFILTSLAFASTSIDSITGCNTYEKIISGHYVLTLTPVSTQNCEGWDISVTSRKDTGFIRNRNLSIIALPYQGPNPKIIRLFDDTQTIDRQKENIGFARELYYVKDMKGYQTAEEITRSLSNCTDRAAQEKLLKKYRNIKKNKIVFTITKIENDPIKMVFTISK
jgi:hypothetical protein